MKNLSKNFPESDSVVFWTNGTGDEVASGAVVDLGEQFGVTLGAIADGEQGAVATAGEFKLAKATGDTFTHLAPVTWDGTYVRAWTPASATKRMGVFTGLPSAAGGNAASGDTVVCVRLDRPASGVGRVYGTRYTVTSDDDAANSGNGRVDFVTGFGAHPSAVHVMVRTVTTNVLKSAFAVSLPTAGTIRVDGVAAGTQIATGDIIEVLALK